MKDFSLSKFIQLGLVVMCALLVPCMSATADKVETPKTFEEGLACLENVLGRYDPDNQLEWRVPTEFEFRQRPKPSEPEILVVFKGLRIIGHPFRERESISFDEVWQWQRQVYDLAEGDKKTLTRTQRSHNVTRYSLSLNSGMWLVNGAMLSNGVHNSIGKPTFQGTVKWRPDGFEFVGASGVDRFYAASGTFILGVGHGSSGYHRRGNRLTLKTRSQSYHLATDPEGNVLTWPDFKRPFGSAFEVEYRSELPTDANGGEVDGTWKLTKYVEDGKPKEEEVRANYRVLRKHGVQDIITKDGMPFSKRKFEIDPQKTPKHIDFIDDTGTRVRGVYEIKGVEMRVAIHADPEKRKKERPSDLREEGNIIAVYERLKGTDKENKFEPGAGDVMSRFSVAYGQSQVEWVEKAYDLNPSTLESSCTTMAALSSTRMRKAHEPATVVSLAGGQIRLRFRGLLRLLR